ncbi:MAG: alpha/beta hydrolase [Pseudomonadales bacterium]|nr:alpha/beta hydrolase [Pseudomonadales bacterium]
MKFKLKTLLASLLTCILTACSTSFEKLLFATVDHPQEPTKRGYVIKDVSFENAGDGIRISGELTYPTDKNIIASVVLISGHEAGKPPATKDDIITGHKYFLTLSHLLTERGYAVLRYDNRGVGKSGGDYKHATDWEFAADAAAALTWLQTKSGLPKTKTGFIGHSQGGIKAVLAAKWATPDFIVSLAGIGAEPLEQALIRQNQDIMRAKGAKASEIERVGKELADLFHIVKTAKNVTSARERIKDYAVSAGMKSESDIEKIQSLFATPWWQAALQMDFNTILKAHNGPILALFGSQDLLVSATANHHPTKALLTNVQSKVKTFDGLNHLFQTALAGKGPDEYWQIETTIEPEVIDEIDHWIRGL